MIPREAEILAKELEKKAKKDPFIYKLEVMFLAFIGYFFLYGLFIIGITMSVMSIYSIIITWNGIIWKLLSALFGFTLVYALIKALIFRIPEPEGLELPREISPLLYKDIREIRKKTKSPRFHKVLFNMDYNACVDQHPRLGGIGFKKNYLIIGLPLLFGISKDEFKSVIGHEMGHVSRRHGMFVRWIFRLRKTLMRLSEHLQNTSHFLVNFLVTPFFNWFLPKFNAYSFNLSRRHEFEADQMAVLGTNPEITGKALCKVETLGLYLDKHFYQEIELECVRNIKPSIRFLELFIQMASSNHFRKLSQTYLNRAYSRMTDFVDTHPSLQDRLKALKAEKCLDFNNQTTAAKHYFARDTEDLVHALDGEWTKVIDPLWKEKHRQYQIYLAQLNKLEEIRHSGEKLHEVENWQEASLTETCFGADRSLPKYQRYNALYPEKSEGIFAVGRILIEKNDKRGAKMLYQILDKDPFYFESSCRLLINYHLEKGEEETASELKERLHLFYDHFEEIRQERVQIRKIDEYVHHDLKEIYLDSIYAMLSRYEFIKKAWVLKKKVKHYEKTPMHVLVFSTRFFSKAGNEEISQACSNLESFCYVPGNLSVADLSDVRHMKKATRIHSDAQIYSYND